MNKKHTTDRRGLCPNRTKATPRTYPARLSSLHYHLQHRTPLAFQIGKEEKLRASMLILPMPKGYQGRATVDW